MSNTLNDEAYWGVDVSKAWVDIAIGNNVTRVKQDSDALQSFLDEYLKPEQKVLCVLESTGGYERLVSRSFTAAGITVHVSHPNKVVNFARARGRLAKTDKIDALLLAQYGQFITRAERRSPKSESQEKLEDYSSRLSQLKDMLHQECCREGTAADEIKACHQEMIDLLKKRIGRIEIIIQGLIDSDDALSQKYQLLCSMKGIGPVVARTLICDLSELGEINHKEIAALVGVAPITRQSGQYVGKGHIHVMGVLMCASDFICLL